MNVTYIIGNGFDLNLDLKTGYQDFYDYYIEVPSPNAHVELLKDTIKQEGYELWSDLEIGLGKISAKYATSDDFMVALADISDHLRKYITGINNSVQIELYDTKRFRGDLCYPSKYLVAADRTNLRAFCNKFNNSWRVNIISFNYTDTINRLLANADSKSGTQIGVNEFNSAVTVGPVQYVHGRCDDTILVGVNDNEQIRKTEFRNHIDLEEMFVKPQANNAIGELTDDTCHAFINASQLICIFGHSMGETDKIWWERIKETLTTRDCRLIIFVYNDKINIKHQRFRRLTIKRELMMKSGWTDSIASKVYIGLNTDIFNLKRSL